MHIKSGCGHVGRRVKEPSKTMAAAQRQAEQAEVVRWVSRIGPGGAVTGAMEVKERDASPADDSSSSMTSAAVLETTMDDDDEPQVQPPPRPPAVRSELIADLPRNQIRLDHNGSVNHVAAVVGGVAVNRYGQMLARVAPGIAPGDGEDEEPA